MCTMSDNAPFANKGLGTPSHFLCIVIINDYAVGNHHFLLFKAIKTFGETK